MSKKPPPQENRGPQGKLFLALSGIALLAAAGWASGNQMLLGPGVVGMLCFLAIYFQRHASLKTFAFTFWVFAFFIGALFYPELFLNWGSFKQSRLIVPLIQLIMFGMGATLSLADFGRALRMPKAVGIGMFLQFSVMPLAGWAIARAFGFDPEVATGIILIGSCSGGVASNVMAYLARGNVALSVTMTACSTIVSPLMTPLLMKLLAGELMAINVFDMMISIVELIILPIGAGLITNAMLQAKTPGRVWRPVAFVLSIVFFVAGLSGVVEPVLGPIWDRQMVPLAVALLLMSVLRQEWLEHGLPVVSMAGICYIIAIIAASNQEKIMTVGAGLFAAALIHNCLGYLLGYWGARAAGVEEGDARTIAFEVGMQNGGMGTALAMEVLKSPSAALGPAIFGTWMNISGSTLASWWKERPPQQSRLM
jgi:BASS family bile acid:Na+ symporter